MNTTKPSFKWSVTSLGLAALAYGIIRRGQDAAAATELKGKVVLITGGSRGLGFAIATELAAQGARLVLVSRHIDELERARARLVAAGKAALEDVRIHAADVTVAEDMREVVQAATVQFGRIDVLVNNAGIIFVGPLRSQTLASFQEAMQSNFFGAVHTTLAVLPQMLERGDGAIVNIASIGGKVAFPHLLPYVASKFALVGWSQGLRAELAAQGVRVNTITPGVLRTGSHIQARYTGNKRAEYGWFAGAASFPLTAVSARAAAKKVVRALTRNSAETAIGLQAVVAARLSNLAPEATAAFLAAANKLLPDGSEVHGDLWGADQSVAGKTYAGSLPTVLQNWGDDAIERYNQQP